MIDPRILLELDECGREGDPQRLLALAREAAAAGDASLAASLYDRAFGLAPDDPAIAGERQVLLDRLAVVEHGIVFRYVPAGSFLMGSADGDPDERPVHPVRLAEFWIGETTVSWAKYCALMSWSPPPEGWPRPDDLEGQKRMAGFHLRETNKLRLQYCEDGTQRARDWHSHDLLGQWQTGGRTASSQELFGAPERTEPESPYTYDRKPMIAASWEDAEDLCARLSDETATCRLPTEAEWEKAARGGRIGCRYSWGDAAPSPANCDFGRFDEFSILPSRTFAPNGYGLFAMCGSVWEWTSDRYDALAYSGAARPADGPRVLRGGSWSDCAEAVTVSFRMSRPSSGWRRAEWGGHLAPNIGFRICRVPVAARQE